MPHIQYLGGDPDVEGMLATMSHTYLNEHSDYVDSVARSTEVRLKKIGTEKPEVPQVVLVPMLKNMKWNPPPEQMHPSTMIPSCVDLVSPNECQQFWGGSGGAEQGISGRLPWGGGGPKAQPNLPPAKPFNLPGTGVAANVFLPAMGSLLVMAGKTVAGILATEGATELLNAVLKRYNVPWMQFRFRSGQQNGQPFGGAAHVKHGQPASRWTGDPDTWAQ